MKEKTVNQINPATTPDEVDTSARRAHEAYRKGASADLATRASWLDAIAAGLRKNTDELVRIAAAETHLGTTRLQGELRRTAFQLELFANEVRTGAVLDATVDHADKDWGMGPRPDIRRVNTPLGVVGVFGASNFPFAFSVIGGDSASALAAGCAVLHKIHSAHRQLALATAEIVVTSLETAGAPEGLFGTVEGREAAVALVEHPLIKAVGFTGSTSVGRSLFDRAAARPEPIPFYGELGSINPVFVLPSAWKNRKTEILEAYAASFTMGMGQFCTKPGLLLVPADQTSATGELLGTAVGKAALGKLLSPGLRDAFGAARDEVAALPGVTTLVAGSDDEVPTPTILEAAIADVLANPEILTKEMFGPATVLVHYEDATDLPKVAAMLEGQLTATLHADTDDATAELVQLLSEKAGRVLWNGWPTGVTVSYAQVHGGPYPATTAPGTTSVGTAATARFQRPVAYQDFPDEALPPALQESNPWAIMRRVDGRFRGQVR